MRSGLSRQSLHCLSTNTLSAIGRINQEQADQRGLVIGKSPHEIYNADKLMLFEKSEDLFRISCCLRWQIFEEFITA